MPRKIPMPPISLYGLSWPHKHFDKIDNLTDENIENLCKAASISSTRSEEVCKIIIASLSEVEEEKSRDSKLAKQKAKRILNQVANVREKMLPELDEFFADKVNHSMSISNFHQLLSHLKETKGIKSSREKRLDILSKVSVSSSEDELSKKLFRHPFEAFMDDLQVIEELFTIYLQVMKTDTLKIPRRDRNIKKNESQQMVWAAANAFYWLTNNIPVVSFPRYEGNENYQHLTGIGAQFIEEFIDIFSVKRAPRVMIEDLDNQANRAWE